MRRFHWGAIASSFLLSIALLCAAAPAAFAFSVQPLLVEIEPGRSGAIRVENTRPEPLTIEVTITRRSVDQDGQQTRAPADDDFVVLPPQMVIQPGRVQVVRLQWVGDEPPTQSISYYANLREVPVALAPTEGAQLQVAFAFDIAVHVLPRNVRPQLALTGAQIARNAQGAPVMRLTIENSGDRYAYLQDASYDLEVLDSSGAVIARPSFTKDALSEILGVTLLEPHKSRTADLPLPDAPNAASVRGRVRAGAD